MRFRASRAGANNLGDAALSASNRRSPESKAMPRWRLLSARGGDVVGAPGTARDFPGVKLTIDQREVVVPAGTTIFDAARISGIPIPTLCHRSEEHTSELQSPCNL